MKANAPVLTLRTLDSTAPGFDAALDALISFEAAQDPAVDAAVAAIIADVRRRGDAAVLEYTARFDRLRATRVAELAVSPKALRSAFETLRADEREALETAAARIRDFHERQKGGSFSIRTDDGSELGQRVTPLDRVGLYVPGGKAAYPSSVLMNAIPAQVAGVPEIVMVVPAPDGARNPLVLAAAHIAGVSRMFTIGGAQAIAALAYGTDTIPAVDKICGPGNAYVAAAKRRVFGVGRHRHGCRRVGNPGRRRRERQPRLGGHRPLLAGRARRDGAGDPGHARRGADRARRGERARWFAEMPRAATIAASFAHRGALIRTRDLDEACVIANRIAPEHLELAVADPDALLPRIRHAGAIFIGHYASEALGDYCAGPNHVLPTGRTARFSSPLGVYDFQKRTSMLRISRAMAQKLAPVAATMASGEGLAAHACSARARLDR